MYKFFKYSHPLSESLANFKLPHYMSFYIFRHFNSTIITYNY